MVQLLLLDDLPPERHNPFNYIDPLFNGSPDETTWSLLDRVCMPMLPNDNTISVRTDHVQATALLAIILKTA